MPQNGGTIEKTVVASIKRSVNMNLTERNKTYIDSLTYRELLNHWRFASMGDPWFQGETGDYWGKRMSELRNMPGGQDLHVSTSKDLGWNKR